MRRIACFSTCSALALGLASGPASAEITAQQVWDNIEAAMQGFGYSVSAVETPSGDGLDVSDVMMRFDVPDENASVSMSIDSIDLVENGDGSVSISFAPVMPIMIEADPEDEDSVDMTLDYANVDLELVVSGDPDNMTYTYSATQMSVSLGELIVDGAPVTSSEARFEFTLDDVAGVTTTVKSPDSTTITQDMQSASVSYDIAFNDPETNDAALIAGSMDALTASSTATLPEGFDPSDPDSLAAGGFSTTGVLGYTNGEAQFAVTENDGGGSSTGTTSTGALRLEFSVDDQSVRYDATTTDQTASVTSPDLPLPVDFKIAGSAFNATLPIAAAEEPQDMAFGLAMRGFEMSELLWNIFDPGAALPRDPATIALDLTGQVTPFVNMFDPEEMARIEVTGETPGELNALTLNNLTIEVAGATLGGSGSFTFDNDDMQTFGGFPRPTGSVDVSLEGANTLIDKLIAMGLLTNEDAMGARMMMSMFAVPGDGPDSLKSSLTINEQGHVLANGMRIQ